MDDLPLRTALRRRGTALVLRRLPAHHECIEAWIREQAEVPFYAMPAPAADLKVDAASCQPQIRPSA